MDPVLIADAAQRLRDAAESGTQCPPVRHLLGGEDAIEAAYGVQRFNNDLAVGAGRRISGRKIGLTSAVVQEQLGVSHPVSGTLFTDTCVADGIDIPAGRLVQPKAEGEIAFVLGEDLDKGEHCVIDVISATAYLLPAIEIVDSRIADWDVTATDMVADNVCSGFFVVGSRPNPISGTDIRDAEMRMLRNGTVASTGRGSACLGNPLHALVWLADSLCEGGTPLRAGDCIMTGSLGPMVTLTSGDEITVEVDPLGTVSTRLTAGG